jgi:3-phenylpropionate/trans-cinnamate dioxygenase ferredoxin component
MTSDSENWIAVCPVDRLAHQAIVCVHLEAVDLLLIRDGNELFACERACPHEQADLSLGRVSDGRLFCPRHLASFGLHDGNVSAGWPCRALRRYPVRIEDRRIWIDGEAIKADSQSESYRAITPQK